MRNPLAALQGILNDFLHHFREETCRLERLIDRMSDQITRLDADVQSLKDVSAAVVTSMAALITNNQALQAKNQALQEAGSPIDLTPEIDGIEGSISNLKAAVAGIGPSAPPAPVGGSTGPLPPADGVGSTSTTPAPGVTGPSSSDSSPSDNVADATAPAAPDVPGAILTGVPTG